MEYIYVAVTLVRTDGFVLIQHRDNNPDIPQPDKWGWIGGKKEPRDKDNKVAACRELLEETGYKTTPESLKELRKDQFYVGKNLVQRYFFIAQYDGIQPIGCNEGQEIKFVKTSDIHDLDFCDSSHRQYLLEIRQQHVIQREGSARHVERR